MKEVLNFDVKAVSTVNSLTTGRVPYVTLFQNGVLFALPYITMYIVTMLVSQLADALLTRKILSITAIRKTAQFLAFAPAAGFISAVGFVGCEQRYMAVVFLTAALAFTGFGRCAYSINHVDVAPR